MDLELQQLLQAVSALPNDVKTRPGEGLGVPSPGYKHLAQIQLLVCHVVLPGVLIVRVTPWCVIVMVRHHHDVSSTLNTLLLLLLLPPV